MSQASRRPAEGIETLCTVGVEVALTSQASRRPAEGIETQEQG